MNIQKGDQFLIPIESFCALNYKFKKTFFIKEMKPKIHKECNDNLLDAYDISQELGTFPYNFYEQGKKRIYIENKLPQYIPVEIINIVGFTEQNDYYKCKDLISHQIFIIPENLLTKKLDSIEKMLNILEQWEIDLQDLENTINEFYVKIHSVSKVYKEPKIKKRNKRK